MNRKKIVIGLSILIVFFLAIFIYFRITTPSEDSRLTINTEKYDVSKEIAEAKKKIEISEPSQIITNVQSFEKVIGLTFDGMVNEETTEQILELLEQYKAPAIFFVPGIKGAEDPKSILKISEFNQEIGNYTLLATKEMEKISKEELLEDIAKTNAILKKITGQYPQLLKANGTEYTEGVLKAAKANNLDFVVKNNQFLSYQSFSSQEDANWYVSRLPKGSIISIKTDSVLDESEYDTSEKEQDEKPAIDKQPDLKENDSVDNKNQQLLRVIEYLLSSLKENNYRILPVKELGDYKDTELAKNFFALKNENDGYLAEVLTHIPTNESKVSFTFRDIEDEETLNNLLNFLKENKIKGTFFVTANEIFQYEDIIQMIIDEGHSLANGGISHDSVTNKSFEEICFEIFKTDQLLKNRFRVVSKFYMPAKGKFNQLVQEAASSLDYKIVTYNQNPIIDDKASLGEILTNLHNGFVNGDIIHFNLNYHKKVNTVIKEMYHLLKKENKSIVTLDDLYQGRNIMENTPSIIVNTQKSSSKKIQQEKSKQENFICQIKLDKSSGFIFLKNISIGV